MAEKIVRSLLKLNRKNYQELYNMNPVLRDGEPVVCVIPASQNAVQQEPCIMLKIGDGTTAFRSLPWISGLSADIYDWALQAQKPVYVANEICFQDGESFQQKYDNGELTGPAGEIPTVDFAAMGLTELVLDEPGSTLPLTQEQFNQLAQQARNAPIKTTIAVKTPDATISLNAVLNGWYTSSTSSDGGTAEFYGAAYTSYDGLAVQIVIMAYSYSVYETYLTGFAKTISNGGGGSDNVTVVDLNILLNGGTQYLTDDEFLKLTSESNVVLIRNTFLQNAKIYFYKSNEGTSDDMSAGEDRIVFLSPATFLKNYNSTFIFEIIIDKAKKKLC